MIIREARAGDEKGMAAAVTAVWKEAYRGIVPDNFLNRMKPDRHEMIFWERIKDGKEFIAVLEDEAGEIAGMASGAKERYGRYDCELIAIYILPEYGRHGFGRQLFHTVTAHLAAQGFRSMIIWTFEKNRDRCFYDGLGGTPSETDSLLIAGKRIPTVGYVWKDVSMINLK